MSLRWDAEHLTGVWSGRTSSRLTYGTKINNSRDGAPSSCHKVKYTNSGGGFPSSLQLHENVEEVSESL